MREVEATGKNIEQAIQNALLELKASREDVDIKILSEGGFLKKAKVLVSISEDALEKYERKEERQVSYNTKEVTTYTRSVKLHVCDKCQHENDMDEIAEKSGCFFMLLLECLIAICVTCYSSGHFRWNWDWALPIILGNLFFGYLITIFVGSLLGKGLRGLWHVITGRKSRKFIRKDDDHPLIKQIKKDGFS